MKAVKFLIGGGILFSLLILSACSNKEPKSDSEQYDEAWYASHATISSDDTNFTSTDGGGTVSFKSEGGEVVIKIVCGTEWTVHNSADDLFDAEWDCEKGTLTITADSNTSTKEKSGNISILTAEENIEFAVISITQDAYGSPEITADYDNWRFPAKGELIADIGIDCSVEDYEVESSETWLAVQKTESGIILEAEENSETTERTARVLLTASDWRRAVSTTINVTQDAKAYVSLSESQLCFSWSAGDAEISVESNYEWKCSYDNSNSWCSVQISDTGIAVTFDENESGDIHEAALTFTAGDGEDNVVEEELLIRQFSVNDIVLVYDIATSGTQVQLPIAGTIAGTVDWGDGSEGETENSANPSHTYELKGKYYVCVSGTVTALNSYDVQTSYKNRLVEVMQWGSTGLTSMYCAFYGCEKLTSLAEDTKGAFEDVTTFERAFYGCSSLATVPAGLFDNCVNVTSFRSVFYNCTSLTGVPDGLFSNSSKASTFEYAFYGCSKLASIPDALFAGCPKTESFYCTFYDCALLGDIPADTFSNCTEATSFEGTFYGCSTLTEIPEGLFDSCQGATSFKSTFSGCYSIESIPGDLFSKCAEATSFDRTFFKCTALTEIPAGLFENCTKVNTFAYTFYDCLVLTSIPESLFANCPDVTTFSNTFNQCIRIQSIPTALFDNCMKVTDFTKTFSQLNQAREESPYSVLPSGLKVHLYERAAHADDLNCAVPEAYTNCFMYCYYLSDYLSISVAGWN